MTFRYFAYGSNMWEPWLRSRCPSARRVGQASLEGWRAVYDKPGADGSAKLNIRPDAGQVTHGVVYEIDDSDRAALDRAEPRYDVIETPHGLTYTFRGEPSETAPSDWYVATVELGAAENVVSPPPTPAAAPDPVAPRIRPATGDDFGLMQSILSEGLRSGGSRYYPHPGEVGWWMYHSDQRHPLTWWVRDDDAFLVLDSSSPGEIGVFTRPDVERASLIEWSRLRLGGGGEVAWVGETDRVLITHLERSRYQRASTDLRYEWALTGDLPEPRLPRGWELRHVTGEHEADNRRTASHAAFESTMSEDMHLSRYLTFMRSQAYVPEHDLVAVAPDGRIASFMVWWADESGVAQIEPFGTHPGFQRHGVGRALLYHGLHEMRRSGMRLARVITNDWRHDATSFYEGVGFDMVGSVSWWSLP
jgi:GNAT superfamily N-acetyltransferase